MKLIKIRFTSWRDESGASRSLVFQQQIGSLTTQIGVLSTEAAHIRQEQAHGTIEAEQKSLAGIAADIEKFDDERTLLLAAEEAVAEPETRAAREHNKTGTFGYQVLNDSGAGDVVDEAGNHLPEEAVYSYEVVDENPLLPEWAKKLSSGIQRTRTG